MASTSKGKRVESGIWEHPSGSGYIVEVSFGDAKTGRRVRERTTTNRLDTARHWRVTKKADALRGEIRRKQDKPDPCRFDRFAERYLRDWSRPQKALSSHQRDINSLKHIDPHFGRKYLAEVTRADVEAYVRQRQATGCAAGTLNRELSCLKNLLRKAVEWGLLETNPARDVSKLREPPGKLEFLSEDETYLLIAACPEPLDRIVTVAVKTGLRRGELFALEWRDVDFDRGLIHVRQSKNGDQRHVPMSAKAREAFIAQQKRGRRLVGGVVSPYVFPSADGGRRKTFRNGLEKALRKAKIRRHIRPHDLRHTFASHLVMKGVDIRTVAELMGHRDIRVTMRYAHLAPHHLLAAVRVLDEPVGPSTVKVA
jgi:site-specific recombinase XerD